MIGAHDLLTRELYSVADASRITRIPATTVRWWLNGRDHHRPVIRDEHEAELDVRWGDILSLFFLAQLRDEGVELNSIRDFVHRKRAQSGSQVPLVTEAVYANGSKLATAMEGGFEDTTGHVWDEAKFIAPYLRRIAFDEEGFAQAIAPSFGHPRVLLHPLIRFGAPQINGYSTEPLADMVAAELRVHPSLERAEVERNLARMYSMPVNDLREAVQFEAEYMERVALAA